jgi:hypothetical protein
MNETEAARFQATKVETRKWYVDDTAQDPDTTDFESRFVDGPYKTRLLAQQAADQLNADNLVDPEPEKVTLTPEHEATVTSLSERLQAAVDEAKANGTIVEVEVDVKHDEPAVDVGAMTRQERMTAAKAEVDQVRAWKAERVGDVPATPVLDWMADPANAAKPAAKASDRKTVEHTPEQVAAIRAIISQGRLDKQSWAKIAARIEAEGIPTVRGGKWYDTTAADLAKKLDIQAEAS